ncbi:unnamed protein product [marine sediment metagenome]|uniref:Uncharacterized protein n=1 Tax=marine sediment metagenome TaxID=412755 RepID=X1NG46_9ZZZZ
MEVFTKEFRDRRWRKCRFGCDLRSCGSGILKNNDSLVKVPSQPFIGPDNPYIVIWNARNKIGVVPRIDDLREKLEQAGIIEVTHADINEAITAAYERKDSWFAGITLED